MEYINNQLYSDKKKLKLMLMSIFLWWKKKKTKRTISKALIKCNKILIES